MPKTTPLLWSRWLLFLSLLLIFYGLAMVFAPPLMNSALVGPLLYHSEHLQSAFARLVEPELLFLNVMNGLLGAVTIGYAILTGWIAFEPFRRGERWAWNALVVNVLAWATLEGYVKLANGLGLRSFAHVGLLIAFAIPLAMTYRHFHPPASPGGSAAGRLPK
ncbi:MAG: hypothetical protein L0322_15970 [Chloroflexi bacterium]|nr:hypothetical protein [Chloroflexota bacterium]MCI0575290.1 hypothetical protein [Chloroflexota bacterium]